MEEIVKRVKKVMDDNGLSAAQMADRIGVQRSAISHILSGRNRPSLDFILRVLESFPELSSEWLLKGQDPAVGTSVPSSEDPPENPPKGRSPKTVEKVLVLYTDRTVEEYLNKG